MHSKFITLLDTLRKEEIDFFYKYMIGIYPRKKAAALTVDYIRSVKKSNEIENLDKETIKKKISKKLPKNSNPNISNTLSDLYLHLKEFLLYEEIKKPSYEQNKTWNKILKQRGLHEKAKRHLKKYQHNLESTEIREPLMYFKKMESYHIEFYDPYTQKIDSEIPCLENMIINLDLFYASMKLKYIAEIENRKNIIGGRKLSNHIEGVTDIIKKYDKYQPSILLTQKYTYELQKNGDEQCYILLKESLSKLAPLEQLIAIDYLMLFASSKLKAGHLKYIEEVFDLYKTKLKNTYFIRVKKISSIQFHNIINLALRLHEYDWVDEFIRTYSIFIEEKNRKKVSIIAKSMLEFEKRKFDNALFLLNTGALFKTPLDQIRVKIIQIQCYYEKNEFDHVENYCHNLDRFLRRNKKIGLEISLPSSNFIKIVRQLLKRELSKEKLISDIQNMESLYAIYWLELKLVKYKSLK